MNNLSSCPLEIDYNTLTKSKGKISFRDTITPFPFIRVYLSIHLHLDPYLFDRDRRRPALNQCRISS